MTCEAAVLTSWSHSPDTASLVPVAELAAETGLTLLAIGPGRAELELPKSLLGAATLIEARDTITAGSRVAALSTRT
ncbi:MAG TPA: hypothetical protein VG756_19245 [Pseudonocardiaceae bacterium]|nr:hypothetical protein [Pseudonocardiaceae bacterium]